MFTPPFLLFILYLLQIFFFQALSIRDLGASSSKREETYCPFSLENFKLFPWDTCNANQKLVPHLSALTDSFHSPSSLTLIFQLAGNPC